MMFSSSIYLPESVYQGLIVFGILNDWSYSERSQVVYNFAWDYSKNSCQISLTLINRWCFRFF
jgi:hypothetical protein